ncbi:MAG: hypothetical protein JST64_15090 [Actinobacteria bacterium]|nr:hypothetical protein [Actinomycetota bacterium]
MRHLRLVIHRLWVDELELPVRFATLVAVERDPNPGTDPDWEVVADLLDGFGGELGHVDVELLCIVGADGEGHLVLGELAGRAVVVRFDERTLVLRGDGPLNGLDPASLEPGSGGVT